MNASELKVGIVVRGLVFPEPIEVLVVTPLGDAVKIVGAGQKSGQVHQRVLRVEQLQFLEANPERELFDGDAARFRLGVEAARLGLAYEYDPYFSLSISRVDPLPHQLEAVYDYFMRLPRIRFLLADDPGAGKTVMAGLLLKELKIRGLVKRTLIVTPANLCFQWQREFKEKFRESFEVIRSDVLRTNYGQNPWQEKDQVITSISWVSRIDDAKESLLRSRWDLVIVDEAHKMAAYSADKKTLAYKLGESLSTMTDHYLLMTATPHKGDPDNFCLFLELLDRDIYGSVESLEEAMRRHHAPFYLRRTKEALVTFPDSETSEVKKLFTKREVRTASFELDGGEYDFYDALTRYVEDQSIKAAEDDSARGRALSFTMAMLQRRFASSVYAVRRSLERMRDKRQKILVDPEKYRKEQIEDRLPGDFDDMTEEEQAEIEARLEGVVASVDPIALREEIQRLSKLIEHACTLERREIESKLVKLRKVLSENNVFSDPKMKLLIFTEHKDTLDYLAGDGKDGRPLGKLRQWNLKTTQIHGGMKVGDRDTPGTRIYAEREFREDAQVLVATEAAGEGINLQFCWFMVNYDIPWNPVRLEQRMGRIHRYGQEHDCLIFNFVAGNTREGRVLAKLLERLLEIRSELGTDQVFDVIGEVFPANLLEKLFREMYIRRLDLSNIEARIVRDVDPERFRAITSSTLEGLAKRELNLGALLGKSAEARERRLVPEVIEEFFVAAGPISGVHPKAIQREGHVYRVGKLPRTLQSIGERQESRFGRLGRDYQKIAFDKALLANDPTLEWVTPGHPLFEAVREDVAERVHEDLMRGAVFYDLQVAAPVRLDVFGASITDGRGNTVSRRLFIVEAGLSGALSIRQPTYLAELALAPAGTQLPTDGPMPGRAEIEQALVEKALNPFLEEIATQRAREVETIARHLEISLGELIHRSNMSLAELANRRIEGENVPGLEGNIAQAEAHLDELNSRLESRRAELAMERHLAIGDIEHIGRAWVLPHPERTSPTIAPMVRDDEIERIAVQEAIRHETERGWIVESVEKDNRGFDIISRKPHPHDDMTFTDVRFIEVKGRSAIGEVALSDNEFKTAERLKKDYWLYVAYNCGTTPELHLIRDPARLGWRPVVQVAHYHLGSDAILEAETL
ncbi:MULTISPECIES: SNF2-related protein [unclassified Bradyrhizobium]|uniref:SNF2-related protein n=1 Tax=unclassified Bradyrhizobium TaxID=2631580 RepID=UPI0028E53CC1|nr:MULTISPECIES: SNF2-related protein [unclassified Bradyrhizobium]